MKHATDTRGVTTNSHVRAVRYLAQFDAFHEPKGENWTACVSLARYRPDLCEKTPGGPKFRIFYRLTPEGREVAKEMGA